MSSERKSEVLWRIADYWQDPEPETSEPRDTFAAVRADLDKWASDFTYIERKMGGGPWVEVAFAGVHSKLPNAWDYDPEAESR